MAFIGQGQTGAFDELYERYSGRLMAFFVRMLGFDRLLAEDALQDLFLKIVEKPGAFDRSRSFKTWIYSVASNACKNHYRHVSVKRKSHGELQSGNAGISHSDADARMDHSRFRAVLDEVLNTLPLEKKEAFILRYQEERSIAEIAEIQCCPEGSVKSRLHYTIKLLEEKLKLFNPAQ